MFGMHALLKRKSEENRKRLKENIRKFIIMDIERVIIDSKHTMDDVIEYSRITEEDIEFKLFSGLQLYNAFLLGREEIIMPDLDDMEFITKYDYILDKRIKVVEVIFDKNRDRITCEIKFLSGGKIDD